MLPILKNFLSSLYSKEMNEYEGMKKEFVKIKVDEGASDSESDVNGTDNQPQKPSTSKSLDKQPAPETGEVSRGSVSLSQTVGKMGCNANKNRYKDIVPYDSNRVVLRPIPVGKFPKSRASKAKILAGEAYINASFIAGTFHDREYIATQGPLPDTVADFWYMVWQENVPLIVMICNLVEAGSTKCERYWPQLGQPLKLKVPPTLAKNTNLSVRLVNHTVDSRFGIVKRVFRLFVGMDNRQVHHYQYLRWPDHGRPKDRGHSLIWLLNQMNQDVPCRDEEPVSSSDLPWVSRKPRLLAHCSAGSGRTGAFIAIHIIMNHLSYDKIDPSFGIYDLVIQLRKQRPRMVQTLDQYIFVYETAAILFVAKLANVTAQMDFFDIHPMLECDKVSQLEGLATERLARTETHVPTLLRDGLLSIQNLYAHLIDLEIWCLYRIYQLEAGVRENSKLWKVRNGLKGLKFKSNMVRLDKFKGTVHSLLALYENEGADKTRVIYHFGPDPVPVEEEEEDDEEGQAGRPIWAPIAGPTGPIDEMEKVAAGIFSIVASPVVPSSIVLADKMRDDIETLYELFKVQIKDDDN